jgi:hypothetical protein
MSSSKRTAPSALRLCNTVHVSGLFTSEHRDRDARRTVNEHSFMSPDVTDMSTNLRTSAARRLIPGAYDRTTSAYRQPGSMGGAAFGSPDMPIGPSSMDAATIAERELEGGGPARERRRTITRIR